MPIKERQIFITNLVSKILGEAPENVTFSWFINKHTPEYFGEDFETIDKIFKTLGGDISRSTKKLTKSLNTDAFFGGKFNLLFEFDEFQHFNSARLASLKALPQNIKVNYSIDEWIDLCNIHHIKADAYRKDKKTTDFNFEGGRTAQRAYLDCFRDILPPKHGLNPTLRVNSFEVENITSTSLEDCKKLEKIIKRKL